MHRRVHGGSVVRIQRGHEPVERRHARGCRFVGLVHQKFGDEVQAVLAEVHPAVDENRGRAEHAALYGFLGDRLELVLDRRVGDHGLERGRVKTGFRQHRGHDCGIAEVALLFPYRGEDRRDVLEELASPPHLHAHRAPHQRERVDREVGVAHVRCAVALRPAGQVFQHPLALGRDLRGAAVAGGLEYAAQQHRPPIDRGAARRSDLRQLEPREVARRAAEVEPELDLLTHHQASSQGRRSISCVQALFFCVCICQ